MMKKQIICLILALVVLLSVGTLAVLAEPEETETTEETASVEETASAENTASTSTSTEAPKPTQKYIPDESVYFASIGEIGDISTVDIMSTEDTGSKAKQPAKNIFDPRKLIAKWIWLPIAVIVICLLVLIGFNQTYKNKYEKIDPAARRRKRKQAEKEANRHSARSSSHNRNDR